MNLKPEIEKEIERIEDNIDNVRASINETEDAINKLLKLNEGRRDYLRRLGQKRSELLTFEFKLS